MLKKTALITGISGQDGSYLAELLLSKGYVVHGLVRRNSKLWNFDRLEHLRATRFDKDLLFHYGDMTDFGSIMRILSETNPDEIFNLAAQSHVQVSFETPIYTAETSGLGVLNLMEAVRILKQKPRIYQASTSELFSGDETIVPLNEQTPFKPRSPYGVAKLYGYEIARVYRESYGMFVVNGILFNHESERRGDSFVSRKITLGLGAILRGEAAHVTLGNLEAKRDWGYAPEYMEGAWRMLQQKEPEDFVLATGEVHSVQEFFIEACTVAGLDWQKILRVSEAYYRPNEVSYLCGDPRKAEAMLGWKAHTKFKDLVKIMVQHDTARK